MQGLFGLSVTLPLDLSSPLGSLVVCAGPSFYFSYAHQAWRKQLQCHWEALPLCLKALGFSHQGQYGLSVPGGSLDNLSDVPLFYTYGMKERLILVCNNRWVINNIAFIPLPPTRVLLLCFVCFFGQTLFAHKRIIITLVIKKHWSI